MDPTTGQLYDHQAFVANPLPTRLADIEISGDSWSRVVAASSALAKLDQAGREIPNPDLLHRPTLRREAQSTSALEGTYAAFTDLLEADLDRGKGARSAEVKEVLNYVQAAEDAFEWIKDRPITLGFLSELQRTLVRGTAGELSDTGRVRDRQVIIGAKRVPVAEARFIPAPPGDVLNAEIEGLLKWIAGPSDIPELVRAALAHYQFETLHPFSDGNGRLGRLMVVLQLIQYGILHYPILIVSPWFEARRRDYQDHLLRTSQTGSFDEWIGFFCEGLRAQAGETARRVEALLDYQNALREQIRDKQIRGVRSRIMEDLVGQPIISVQWAADRHGVSYQAANEAIGRLVKDGILDEISGRNYDRLFAARRVLVIIED